MKKLLFLLLLLISQNIFALTEITLTGFYKNPNGYSELSYMMRFALPSIFGTTQAPLAGLQIIVSSFPDGYVLEKDTTTIPASYYIDYSGSISSSGESLAQLKTRLQNKYTAIRNKLDGLTLTPVDNLVGLSWDGTIWK